MLGTMVPTRHLGSSVLSEIQLLYSGFVIKTTSVLSPQLKQTEDTLKYPRKKNNCPVSLYRTYFGIDGKKASIAIN